MFAFIEPSIYALNPLALFTAPRFARGNLWQLGELILWSRRLPATWGENVSDERLQNSNFSVRLAAISVWRMTNFQGRLQDYGAVASFAACA